MNGLVDAHASCAEQVHEFVHVSVCSLMDTNNYEHVYQSNDGRSTGLSQYARGDCASQTPCCPYPERGHEVIQVSIGSTLRVERIRRHQCSVHTGSPVIENRKCNSIILPVVVTHTSS